MSILYVGWSPVPTDEEIEASINDHEEAFGREELEAISDAANNCFYLNPLDLPDYNPAPTFMADSQGQYMFTPGSVVTIFGEPGVRKSFLLQTAIGEHFGIMMQMESSPRGLIFDLCMSVYIRAWLGWIGTIRRWVSLIPGQFLKYLS